MPVAAAEPPTRTGVSVRITLPESIYSEYEQQARTAGATVEEMIAARALTAVDYTSGKPLYFTDTQRQELERILGRNVKSTGDVLRLVQDAMSVKVEKVVISLKLSLLQKLKTRCIGVTWEKFIEERIVHELERYVGMR